ncbi:MAG: cadherin-like beta sandwich domain-containing protein [Lachnospiraceae bacterium]|nr:cadherin-like beta sandwich domain-containing protein [Lachnospiraceae bacterium]
MNNKYRRLQMILAAVWMVLIMIGVNRHDVLAATGNVSIAVSAGQLNVGDALSVTVTISSDAPIGAYSMAVSYDPSVLEYTGGDGNGGGGTVNIAGYGDGSATRLSAQLSFKAIANGSSSLATSGSDAYAYDETVLSMNHASTVVTVSAPTTQAPTTQTATEAPSTSTASDGTTAASATDTTASTDTTEVMDTSLKSLEISSGTLVPVFSPSVTSYSVELPEDTTSIIVSALAKDSTASVTVTHNNDLEPGFNRSYIVVTAANGAQMTYTLNITCGEVKEPQDLKIDIDGVSYVPVDENGMSGVMIPDGFSAVSVKYEDQELTAYETSDHKIQILYLINDEQKGAWFVYEEVSRSFYPYVEVPVMVGRYVILRLPQEITLPVGYSRIDLNVNGQSVMAYAKDAQDELVLVYAAGVQGTPGLYLYDKTESTFQRYLQQYRDDTVPAATTADTVTETEISTDAVTEMVQDSSENERFTRVRTLLYIVCVIVVLLLIVLVVMIMGMSKRLPGNGETLTRKDDRKETGNTEQTSLDYEDED